MTRPRPTTDGRFTFDVLRADGPVLVDFYADWCRSCQLLDPVLDIAPGTRHLIRTGMADGREVAFFADDIQVPLAAGLLIIVAGWFIASLIERGLAAQGRNQVRTAICLSFTLPPAKLLATFVCSEQSI